MFDAIEIFSCCLVVLEAEYILPVDNAFLGLKPKIGVREPKPGSFAGSLPANSSVGLDRSPI